MKVKRRSSFLEAWIRLRKNKLAIVCLAVVCLLILIAVFADLITPYENAIANNSAAKFAKPSAEHWFGCDNLGRDMFARVIHGSRVSLLLGFGATAVATVAASLLGSAAAFIGGKFDTVVMRLADILSSIPPILLSLAIAAGFGRGLPQLVISIDRKSTRLNSSHRL